MNSGEVLKIYLAGGYIRQIDVLKGDGKVLQKPLHTIAFVDHCLYAEGLSDDDVSACIRFVDFDYVGAPTLDDAYGWKAALGVTETFACVDTLSPCDCGMRWSFPDVLVVYLCVGDCAMFAEDVASYGYDDDDMQFIQDMDTFERIYNLSLLRTPDVYDADEKYHSAAYQIWLDSNNLPDPLDQLKYMSERRKSIPYAEIKSYPMPPTAFEKEIGAAFDDLRTLVSKAADQEKYNMLIAGSRCVPRF